MSSGDPPENNSVIISVFIIFFKLINNFTTFMQNRKKQYTSLETCDGGISKAYSLALTGTNLLPYVGKMVKIFK